MTGGRPDSRTIAYAAGLVLVFALALFVRERVWTACGGGAASYLDWAQQHYYGGISRVYVRSAEDLARGHPYTTVAYPPGYPAFLALLIRSGLTLQHVRIVQFVVDALAVFATAALLRSIGVMRIWALAGALAYALHPLWATGSVYLLAEAFSPAIVVAFLWSLVESLDRSPRAAIAPGLVAGVGALFRPDFLLLVVPGLVWFLVVDRRPGRLRAAAWFASTVCVFVLLWGVHNKRTHGIWMFGTTASGAGLWEGLGELPNDYGYVLDDAYADRFLRSHGLAWASLEANRFFTREFVRAVREHPGHVARVIVHRWRRIVVESEPLRADVFARLRSFVDTLGVVVLAAAIALARRRRDVLFVAAMPLVFAMLSIGLVHYEARYVRYAQLSYLVGGIVLLDALWSSLTDRVAPRPRTAIAVMLAAVAFAHVGRQLVELDRLARIPESPIAGS